MNKHFFLILNLVLASQVAAKPLTFEELKNQSNNAHPSNTIFTLQQRNKYMVGLAAICGTVAGGITHYCGKSTLNNQMIAAGVAALASGVALYCAVDTPKTVLQRAANKLAKHAELIIYLQSSPIPLADVIKGYYIHAEYPLLSGMQLCNDLITESDLFIDMMKNTRITASMSADELARCSELVPLFEEARNVMNALLLAIKSDKDFAAEYSRRTARIQANAAMQAALAQASAANAQWNRTIHAYKS